jgi:hypothetical protein
MDFWRRHRAWHLLGLLGLAGWVALAVVSHRVEHPLLWYLGTQAWAWLVFVAAWRLARRADSSGGWRAILLWAVLFRLCGLMAAPVMEDDHFRFLWDGRQFAVTGNPYATAPADHFDDETVPPRFQEILDQINYPHVPTIYGPVCQLDFLVSHWIAPGQLWPWKLLVAGCDLVLLALVVLLAGRAGQGTGVMVAALLMGWCPLAVFETSVNAHPDVVGVALLVGAVWMRTRASMVACGVLCGLAVAAKLFALPLAPFLLWRSWKAAAGFAGAVVLANAPFWLQGSTGELAGLAAFAREWEFNSSLYALAKLAWGPDAGRAVCGALFAVVWLWLLARWARRHPVASAHFTLPPGDLVFGALLLFSATVNPWYLLWLAPFVALRPSLAGLSAMALVSLSYVTGLNAGLPHLGNFEHPVWVRWVEYGAWALVVALGAVLRGARASAGEINVPRRES